MNMPIPLVEVFTAAGAVTWAAAITGLTMLLKQAVPFIPDHGRGVLYLVMALSALVVGLALFDAQPANFTGELVIGALLTWGAVVTAASGAYEIGSKTGRVIQGTTNTTGPDEDSHMPGVSG